MNKKQKPLTYEPLCEIYNRQTDKDETRQSEGKSSICPVCSGLQQRKGSQGLFNNERTTLGVSFLPSQMGAGRLLKLGR